jgi:hypothetical protein
VEVFGDIWESKVLQAHRPPIRGLPTHLVRVAIPVEIEQAVSDLGLTNGSALRGISA